MSIWDFNSFSICWQRAVDLFSPFFLSKKLHEIIFFWPRKQRACAPGTKKLWIIESSVTYKAKYCIFLQENELHTKHNVAIILERIRERSGKAALEPVRGLITMETFDMTS